MLTALRIACTHMTTQEPVVTAVTAEGLGAKDYAMQNPCD